MSEIQADNQDLRVIIDNQLKRLDVYIRTANDNKHLLEIEFSKSMKNLEKSYSDKIKQIEENYAHAKKEVENLYRPLVKKFQNNEKMFDDFRFRIWEGVTKFGDRTFNEEGEVVRQIFYVGIAELCEVRNRPITDR